jgi:predicted dehydrogenase
MAGDRLKKQPVRRMATGKETHMHSPQLNRRNFLAGAVGGAAGWLILPSSRSARAYQANERLNLGIIGVAGYAAATAFMPALHIYENVGITALCDVDQRKAGPQLEIWKERARTWPESAKPEERRAAEHYQRLVREQPLLFEDFRRMFDRMADRIDAVVVATPDHTHAVASAAALRAGKHVLCEKPLAISAHESRALRDLAIQHRVATSLGNQGTQSNPFRRALELIREGAIGPVEQVHVWFARGGRNHQQPPQGTQPIPPELNWDLWLGPAAWREYHPGWIARCHWRDTGIGELGNFGPHTANLAFMALDVVELWQPGDSGGAAIRVDAECSQINRLSFPVWERIRWQVPARGGHRPVTFTWHHGPDYAPGSRELFEGMLRGYGESEENIKKLLQYAGAILIGSKGAIVTDSHNVSFTMLPRKDFHEIEKDRPKVVPASRGHYRDWIHACRGGEAPWARFEYAAPFNEFLTLGDVATRFAGEALEYDPIAGRILNHPQANQALRYEYRQGWSL